MSEKRYPKDLQDIFQATRADLEVQLAETENFAAAANTKSFDAVLRTVSDTQSMVGGFVKEMSDALDKASSNGKSCVESLQKKIQNISSLQARMTGTDRSKDLIAFKQSITKELESELAKLTEKF